MRILNNWNIGLIVLLFFLLILLNYFNLVPISKTFPFLSFLPQASKPKISQQVVTVTPTPLPPITVKKIDPLKGEGEFVINNPTRPVAPPSAKEQVIVDGTYSVESQDITVKTSIKPLYGHSHPFQFLERRISDIYLTITITINNESIYQAPLALTKEENQQSIPFSTIIPFYENSTINIYDESEKLLLSQQIKR